MPTTSADHPVTPTRSAPPPARRAWARRVAVGAALLVAVSAACTSGGQTVATTTTAPTTTTVPETTTTTEPPMDAGRQLFVFNPEGGHCFDNRDAESGASTRLRTDATRRDDEQVVLLVECDVPHQYEVAGGAQITLTGDYPGEDPLVREAQRLCPPVFSAFVGAPYERSALEMGWILPTQEQWGQGRRDVTCLVLDTVNGRLTGSVQGSRR
jgi:hypothetical protein